MPNEITRFERWREKGERVSQLDDVTRKKGTQRYKKSANTTKLFICTAADLESLFLIVITSFTFEQTRKRVKSSSSIPPFFNTPSISPFNSIDPYIFCPNQSHTNTLFYKLDLCRPRYFDSDNNNNNTQNLKTHHHDERLLLQQTYIISLSFNLVHYSHPLIV